MTDFDAYQVLTFDCYGTLVDWEGGLLGALGPVLAAHNVYLSDREILELYHQVEPTAEKGEYVRYREILGQAVEQFGKRLGFSPTRPEIDCLAASLKDWRPFPDTVPALRSLKKKIRLAVISNIDDDLFALSAKHLEVEFDWVITAEQARAYKPSLSIFRLALERIGVPRERVLHVAQSIYHDVTPAKSLGLSTVWVNRKTGREGAEAAPSASVHPDLEVPDLHALLSLMGLHSQ